MREAERDFPIRIVIADDHPLLRQGLRQALELEPDLRVIGEAGNAAECLALARDLRPDVILLDLSMPGTSGLEAARQIREELPGTAVVVLTMHDDEEYLFEAIRAGVSGYLLKDVEPAELVRAIRSCRSGDPVLQPHLAGKLMHGLRRLERDPQEEFRRLLSEREREVLQRLAAGESNREIAASLFISEKTVKNHATNIFRKMGVSDRTQAAIEALRRGWVRL